MKLLAASPFTNASVTQILAFLETVTATLVLLPGHHKNTPSPSVIQGFLKRGVSVFVEGAGKKTAAIPYFVTREEIVPMPRQIFSEQPTAQDIDDLAASMPDRTFRIGKRRVTFFICGELLAFNPDGTVKYHRKISYDVLANPAHTLMGHWNYLGKKLERLSKRSMALYAANNDKEHSGISTDVRIYKRGKHVSKSFLNRNQNITWCECEL